MAKKRAPAVAQPVAEKIPSIPGGLSGIASANAPVVFFDEVPFSGFYNGIAHLTLEAVRFMVVDGNSISDRMVVAHLRMNLVALTALKNAVLAAERAAQDAIKKAAEATRH